MLQSDYQMGWVQQDCPGICVQEHANQGISLHLVPMKAAYKSDHLSSLSTLMDAFRFPLTMVFPATPSTADGTSVSTEQTRPSSNLVTKYFGASSTNHVYAIPNPRWRMNRQLQPLWPRRLRMRYKFRSYHAAPGMGHQVPEFTSQEAVATKFCTFRNMPAVRRTLLRDWFIIVTAQQH